MIIEKIKKRDGTIVSFEQGKITNAIYKTAEAQAREQGEEADLSVAEKISDRVISKLEVIFASQGLVPDVEHVQDIVQKEIGSAGYIDTALRYATYREQHKQIRDIKAMFDGIEVIENYIEGKDWRVKENANMDYSLQGLNTHITNTLISGYWQKRIYPQEIQEAHVEGDLHIHDLGTLGAYCVGWDLEDILRTGFRGVPGKLACKPPKHFRAALGQIVNFFYTLQGESAGAQALSNFDTYLAPFIRHDGLNFEQVKKDLQSFFFNMSVPTRVGFQTPFTNVTLDLKVPGYLKDNAVIIEGELQNETYGEFQEEVNMFNRAFAENLVEGDADGRVFTFPIPTYNITKDFDWDDPNLEPLWEMTAKYGIPYFSNYINSDMKPEDARSMCCRLRLDQTELRKRGGGLFGANPQTGSIGVVTINMARLGYTSSNEDEFFGKLEKLMILAKDSLEIKRKALERFTQQGLYPYSKFFLRTVNQRFGEYWKNHFSTIGLLGMNEAITNFMPGETIATEQGRDFALRTLDFMSNKTLEFQKEGDDMYNLEATPGEGTTYTFARKDQKRFPDIKFANTSGEPYYTNSTQLPVGHTDDFFEALELQDALQIKYTGGTVLHGFIGERMSADGAKKLTRTIAEKFHLPYFTITPTFSICSNHGYLSGDHEYCPKCDLHGEQVKPERYSRIVGYLRPLQKWNLGKQSEWNDRKMFKIAE